MVKVTQVCFKSSLENLPATTIKKSKEWSEEQEEGEGNGGGEGEQWQVRNRSNLQKQVSGNKRVTESAMNCVRQVHRAVEISESR